MPAAAGGPVRDGAATTLVQPGQDPLDIRVDLGGAVALRVEVERE